MGVSGAGSHADKNIATPDEAMHFSFLICNASFRNRFAVELRAADQGQRVLQLLLPEPRTRKSGLARREPGARDSGAR